MWNQNLDTKIVGKAMYLHYFCSNMLNPIKQSINDPMSWVCAKNLSRVWDKWVLPVYFTQSNNQLVNTMSWVCAQNLSRVWDKWALPVCFTQSNNQLMSQCLEYVPKICPEFGTNGFCQCTLLNQTINWWTHLTFIIFSWCGNWKVASKFGHN